MTHYDTDIIAYNSVIIATRFADADGLDIQSIQVSPLSQSLGKKSVLLPSLMLYCYCAAT